MDFNDNTRRNGDPDELTVYEPVGSWHLVTKAESNRLRAKAERDDRRMQIKLECARLRAQPDLDRRCRIAVLHTCELLMQQTDEITGERFYCNVERILGRSLKRRPWDQPVCTTLAYRELPGLLEFIRICRGTPALAQAFRLVFDYILFSDA